MNYTAHVDSDKDSPEVVITMEDTMHLTTVERFIRTSPGRVHKHHPVHVFDTAFNIVANELYHTLWKHIITSDMNLWHIIRSTCVSISTRMGSL